MHYRAWPEVTGRWQMQQNVRCTSTWQRAAVLALTVLIVWPAYGQQSPALADVISVRAGEVVPYDGMLLAPQEADELASHVENLEAALAAAQEALRERTIQVRLNQQLVDIRAQEVRRCEGRISAQRWVAPVVGVVAFLLGNKSATGFTVNVDPFNPAPRR